MFRSSAFGKLAILGLLVLAQLGCGGDGKVDVYPVKGQVLYQGKPVEGASVIFFAANPEMKVIGVPTPKGTTNANGEFVLDGYERGDGAPAGEYAVAISWMEVVTPSDDPEQRIERDRLKGRYADSSSSGLVAKVEEIENKLPPFELQ